MNTALEPREFVIQPNAISQSIYSCGTYARRMMAMAMSLLPLEPTGKNEDYTVSFSVDAFLKSLGMERGTKTQKLLIAALDESAGALLKMFEDSGDYVVYTWFKETRLRHISKGHTHSWDTITMEFNPELAKVIGDFRRQYAKINLLDFGKLQSRYAIRLYELALSFSGFAGKDGNPRGEWFFQKSIEDIRLLFDVGQKKYKVVNEFRRNVIDAPIEEINAADIGIRIEPEYLRRGKYLTGIRFNCRWAKREEPRPTQPATETGQEEEKLKNAYPEEFEKFKAEWLAEKQKQPGLFKDNPAALGVMAESAAAAALRERYPEPRPKRKPKK